MRYDIKGIFSKKIRQTIPKETEKREGEQYETWS